jgi:dihydrofolate synthase/folylpolyglutamate synthase
MKRAGYTVGCLRMPLRDEPRENVCINSQSISMDEFAELCATIRQVSKELDIIPSRAEILLTLALLSFKRQACDMCIIESDHFGNDPSMMLPSPFAAVICGAFPSNDAAEISRIRSYICKGISEIVSVPQNSEAYRIISDTCYSINCRLTLPSKNAITIDKLTFRGTEFTYKDKSYSLNLCGRFQVTNAVLLLEAVEMLSRKGYNIDNNAVNEGLSSLRIPAKFETLSVSPLIIVDSTHTPVAIETVCDSMTDFKMLSKKQIRLCLPNTELIRDYVEALQKRGYKIEKIVTEQGEPAYSGEYDTCPCKSKKELARTALDGLDKDTVLLISGHHSFVIPVRYELLSILGF